MATFGVAMAAPAFWQFETPFKHISSEWSGLFCASTLPQDGALGETTSPNVLSAGPLDPAEESVSAQPRRATSKRLDALV